MSFSSMVGPVQIMGITELTRALTDIQRSLSALYDKLGSSYIALDGNNTFTGTDTFKLPPIINAGAVGTATFLPMGALDKQASAAGIGNGADLTDDTLFTYSLPANALDANNRTIIVDAFGSFAANGNNKTVKLWFGASVAFSSGVLTNNNVGWSARLILCRTGASAQIGSGFGMAGSTPFPVPLPLVGTEVTTGAITIKTTGASPTTGAANDVKGYGMVVTYLN